MRLLDSETGEIVFDGRRVTRSSRCPVCGHETWCLLDEERGTAICPRVESRRKIGSAGWWHAVAGVIPNGVSFSVARRETPPLEGTEAMQMQFVRQGGPRIGLLALALGLSVEALERLGTGWNGSAWTFPMRNHREDIVGFRTRFDNGAKFAIKGSRSGIFVPSGRARGAGAEVWIVEGPTDCAAMLDMGLNAIGRPSCRGSEEEICRWATDMRVTIVADADDPGIAGAEELTRRLRGSVRSCRTVLPPWNLKDAREVLNHGGSSSDWRTLAGDGRSPTNTNGPTRSS
jgi:hypothetical protein